MDEAQQLWERTEESERTEENQAILESAKADVIKSAEEKFRPNLAGAEVMASLGDGYGVLSLSRTERSLLMWAHYTHEGKGFVVGFDDEHPFFHAPDVKGRPTSPMPVVYTTKRSMVVIGQDRFQQRLMCQKPMEWAYEEEERLFRSLKNIPDRAVGTDRYGQSIVLTHVPKEAVKEVYLGYRSDSALESAVNAAIMSHEIECKTYRARICDDQYRVVFDEVGRA